jgi:hypothetical protein
MKRIPVLIAATILFIMACICSAPAPSAPPEKVGEVTAGPTAPAFEIFGVGDVIQAGNLTVVLNSVEFQGNILVANFTIENKGSEETTISTLIQFSAKDADGSDLEEEIFECGSSSIGGSILPGDKSRGNVCYKNVRTDNARIYFEPDFLSSQTVVWEVSK